MKRSRKRTLRAKPGELIAYYGYADGDGPDICAAYGAAGAHKADGRILLEALSAKVCGLDLPLWKELESRGYDLRTLKFTIRQKVNPTAPPPF